LDDDEIPRTNGVVDHRDGPIESTDSGTVNQVSSSIEILTGPQSSQQSVEHIPNASASQLAIANAEKGPLQKPRDSKEIEHDALGYAKEVETALFDKNKEFSREKKVWQPGAAYKSVFLVLG
jgi:hypothetical protein